jgi:hypothetical protein
VLCQVLYHKAPVSCLKGFADSKVAAIAQVTKNHKPNVPSSLRLATLKEMV